MSIKNLDDIATQDLLVGDNILGIGTVKSIGHQYSSVIPFIVEGGLGDVRPIVLPTSGAWNIDRDVPDEPTPYQKYLAAYDVVYPFVCDSDLTNLLTAYRDYLESK